MTPTTQDRQAIADLMTGWMHRDVGNWDQLRELFHHDGTIDITWFQGSFGDFVDASMAMGASDFRTKHVITAPIVTFSADDRRAVTETNAMVIGENATLRLGCTTHNRFIDQVEQRDGTWRIAHRKSVYDFSSFTFPLGLVEVDGEDVGAHPREYAALAYLLDQSGFPVEGPFPTKGSDQE